MVPYRGPFGSISAIVAISLFSTVFALFTQRLFGKSVPLVLIGPIVAVAAVLCVFRWSPPNK